MTYTRETNKALSKAVTDAIGVAAEGFSTNFVLIFQAVTSDGRMIEDVVVPVEGQLLTTSSGLLRFATVNNDHHMIQRKGQE